MSIMETTLHPISKHMELIDDFCAIYEMTVEEFNDMAVVANRMGLEEYEARARKAFVHALFDIRGQP